MALRRSIYQAALAQGLNAGGKDPLVAPDGPLRLENAVFTREGAVSKRTGTLSLTGTHGDPFMGVYDDRPVLIGDTIKLFNGSTATAGSFDTAETADLLYNQIASPMDVDPDVVDALGNDNMRFVSCVSVGQVTLYTYTHYSALSGTMTGSWAIFNRYSKHLIVDTAGAGSFGACTRGFVVDSRLFLLSYNGSGVWILDEINTTTGATISSAGITGTTAIDNATHPYFDVAVLNDTSIMLVYVAATLGITVSLIDVTAGTLTSEIQPTGTHNDEDAVAAAVYDTTLGQGIALWHSADGAGNQIVYAQGYDSSGASILDDGAGGPITLKSYGVVGDQIISIGAVAPDGGGVFYAFWTRKTAAAAEAVRIHGCKVDGGTVTSSTTGEVFRHCYLASKPWLDSNENLYAMLYYESSSAGLQAQYLIARLSKDTTNASTFRNTAPVARFFAGTAGHRDTVRSSAGTAYPYLLPDVHWLEANTWEIAALKITHRTGSVFQVAGAKLTVKALTTTALGRVRGYDSSKGMLCTGAHPYLFDGRVLDELGFMCVPTVTATADTASGSLAAGDWLYVALYESYDERGNRKISGGSVPVTATLSATGHIDVTITTLPITRSDGVRVVLYRSEAVNSTTLRRISTQDNDATADSITFADNGSGSTQASGGNYATITTEELLYTATGELDNEPPPPFRMMTLHQSRQVVVNRENEAELLQYSKTFVDGLAPEHTSYNTIRINPAGGAITAIASMDEYIIVFKREAIYAIGGTGYDAAGAGQNYPEPRLVSAGIGCTNAQSVVVTPQGLMFLSGAGIFLLTRGMQLSPVGRAVKYHSDSLTITAASCIASKDHVIFQTSGTLALVYNYLYGLWSTFTDYTADAAVVAMSGTLYWHSVASPAVAVRVEQTGYYDIAVGTRIQLLLETGWYNLAGLAGYGRLYRILVAGWNIASHTLTLKVGYDGENRWQDTLTLDASALTAMAPTAYFGAAGSTQNNAYVLKARGSKSRCRSVRFSIADSGAVNESLSLVWLGLYLGMKQGPVRLGTTRAL